MLQHVDHITIAVEDPEAAAEFFGLLGFALEADRIVEGEKFADYMGVPGLRMRHLTLALKGSDPRLEVQVLHYLEPRAQADPNANRLDKLGFNHVCFAVNDIEAAAQRLRDNGVALIGKVMQFNNRKLMYFAGPEGITLELAQWD